MQAGIIMGSASDLSGMRGALKVLDDCGISYEVKVVSAHRTPEEMAAYAGSAKERGLSVIIAGAGGSAHLPGMVAAMTTLPVIGVPIESKTLKGLDSLLSIVQMPKGVPVAAVGINDAAGAGYFAARILALVDTEVRERLDSLLGRM